MTTQDTPELRRGWTTGACATAATEGALAALWGGAFPATVRLTLPRGETPEFALVECRTGPGWAECGVVKDAGDDPDVTHGCTVMVRVCDTGTANGLGRGPISDWPQGHATDHGTDQPTAIGILFRAGPGVGTVTRPGLPIGVGEPAINPVPRQMMAEAVARMAARHGKAENVELTVSIPGGAEIAARTWNPRLGIEGGLSVLGTTGVVRPFSCAAWIASIHRGIDVARAAHLPHVAGCTGATSERAVQAHYALPDHAMLDMGDFAGGLLKYLGRHPLPRITIAGGIGKMAKLAQGARDLHSKRSQVDIARLARLAAEAGLPDIADAETALDALERAGPGLAAPVARDACATVRAILGDAEVRAEVMVVARDGKILACAGGPAEGAA